MSSGPLPELTKKSIVLAKSLVLVLAASRGYWVAVFVIPSRFARLVLSHMGRICTCSPYVTKIYAGKAV